jgi:hypothetical protein
MFSPYLYFSDDLIILNKPYGIGLSPPPPVPTQHSRHMGNTLVGEKQYYLTEALPHIARNLGYNSLTVLKVPERFVLVRYAYSKVLYPYIYWNCAAL